MSEFADNFSKDKRITKTNWLCSRGQRESDTHIMEECLVYEDIRNDYKNLSDDTQLASFFDKVLERRRLIDDLDEGESEENTMVAEATDV